MIYIPHVLGAFVAITTLDGVWSNKALIQKVVLIFFTFR